MAHKIWIQVITERHESSRTWMLGRMVHVIIYHVYHRLMVNQSVKCWWTVDQRKPKLKSHVCCPGTFSRQTTDRRQHVEIFTSFRFFVEPSIYCFGWLFFLSEVKSRDDWLLTKAAKLICCFEGCNVLYVFWWGCKKFRIMLPCRLGFDFSVIEKKSSHTFSE